MDILAQELTPQECRIEQKMTDSAAGVSKERKKIMSKLERLRESSPRFSIDRARLFTESFRETEGQHQTLRWAKALKHVAENMA